MKLVEEDKEEIKQLYRFKKLYREGKLDCMENKKIRIEIPLMPRSKKNSQQMILIGGKPRLIQSKLYLQYEKDCGYFLKPLKEPIDKPINLKCTFIVPDKRKRDLSNLLNAIQDILVHYKILADDNYNIVQSVDGSRIIYEKDKEKTVIEIEEVS